jgi:hypothetical protein
LSGVDAIKVIYIFLCPEENHIYSWLMDLNWRFFKIKYLGTCVRSVRHTHEQHYRNFEKRVASARIHLVCLPGCQKTNKQTSNCLRDRAKARNSYFLRAIGISCCYISKLNAKRIFVKNAAKSSKMVEKSFFFVFSCERKLETFFRNLLPPTQKSWSRSIKIFEKGSRSHYRSTEQRLMRHSLFFPNFFSVFFFFRMPRNSGKRHRCALCSRNLAEAVKRAFSWAGAEPFDRTYNRRALFDEKNSCKWFQQRSGIHREKVY